MGILPREEKHFQYNSFIGKHTNQLTETKHVYIVKKCEINRSDDEPATEPVV